MTGGGYAENLQLDRTFIIQSRRSIQLHPTTALELALEPAREKETLMTKHHQNRLLTHLGLMFVATLPGATLLSTTFSLEDWDSVCEPKLESISFLYQKIFNK